MDAAPSFEPISSREESQSQLLPRARAFGIHLVISLTIAAVVIWMIVFHWYPGPYFASDGGWRGTVIVLSVDLVLGPMLTLIIYDPRKSIGKIRFDFTVIGLVQASALAWGIYAVEGQRPAAVAWNDRAFNPVTAEVLRGQGIALERISALSDEHPPLLFTRIPDDPAALAEMRRQRIELGLMPHSQVDLLRGLEDHLREIALEQEQVAWLAKPRPEFAEELESFLSEHGKQLEDLVWVPFNGRYGRLLFALEPNGRLAGALTRAYQGLL